MAQISELKHKGKVIYPLTHEDAVVDDNGKTISEKLKEISVGGAEGALVYNAPQTLTDKQKAQVAKNIGQPRERLILEWTNDEAEVLQPTAYDAETGYFTTDKMPSWLAEDGASVEAVVNYVDDIFSGKASSKNVVQGTVSGANEIAIQRISATQFFCHYSKTNITAAPIPATVDVTLFYFTRKMTNFAFQLLKDGELSPTQGIKKFHIHITDVAARESRYTQFWLNGAAEYSQGQNNYLKYPSSSVGYFSPHSFGTVADMEVWVDYGVEGGPKGKFVRIDSNGIYFNTSNGNLEYYVNPTMHSQWGDMWGYATFKQCYLQVSSLGSRATVRITEIID